MARFGSLLAVAIGGAAGALSRWGLLSLAGEDSSRLTLFAINVVGSLLLGVIIGNRERIGEEWHALLGTGFAGGLTTFSTFAVSVAADLEDGRLLSAVIDGLGTMTTVLMAAGIGYRLSRVVGSRRWLSPSGRLGRAVKRRRSARRRPGQRARRGRRADR